MNDKGKNILELFNSIRSLFNDIKMIIDQFDTQFYNNGYRIKWGSSTITNGVSASLYNPNNWLLTGIYRIYEKEENEILGFNISFGNESPEPLFIAGKIIYNTKEIKEWDLWTIWFREPKEKISNGEIIDIPKEYIIEKNIDEIKIFAIPLVEIETNSNIESIAKIIIGL